MFWRIAFKCYEVINDKLLFNTYSVFNEKTQLHSAARFGIEPAIEFCLKDGFTVNDKNAEVNVIIVKFSMFNIGNYSLFDF